MCMHGVECCGENPQDAPSFHSYVFLQFLSFV